MALSLATWSTVVVPTETTAEQILAAAAQVYARARTYRDEGEQTNQFEGQSPAVFHTQRTVFRTALERPHRFLFQYQDVEHGSETAWAGGAVWRDADGTRAWSSFVPGIRENVDLRGELLTHAGVSRGLSTLVPGLLLREMGGRPSILQASGASVIGVELVEGHPCYGIDAQPRRPTGRKLVLWFDTQSWLLRRVDESMVFDAAASEWQAARLRASLAQPDLTARNRGILERALGDAESGTKPDYRVESATTWRPHLDVAVSHEECAFVLPAWASIDPGPT